MTPPQQRPTPVLLTLTGAGIAFALSQTLVVPALPALAQEFDASPNAVSWVLTGFLVSASIATPIAGKLGDLYGKGRVLTAIMIIFSIGAVINALAPSIEVLIAGRVLQGVAGGVFPLAFGIIRDTFPRDQVAGGIAIISAVFGIGGGIGLPLSGLIVDHVNLDWLFWVSLIALPVAYAVHRFVPPSPPVENTKVDWLGAVVLSAGLAAILLGVSQAGEWGWGSPANVGAVLGGVVADRPVRVDRDAGRAAVDRHGGAAQARRRVHEPDRLPGRHRDVLELPRLPAVRAGAGEHGLRVRLQRHRGRASCCCRRRSRSSRPGRPRPSSASGSASAAC